MSQEELFTPSESSLQFPTRMSGISRQQMNFSRDESVLKLLETETSGLQGEMRDSSHFLSRVSNSKADLFRSQRDTIKLRRRGMKRKRKRERQRRPKKGVKMRARESGLSVTELTKLINQNSDFTEIGNLALRNLVTNNLGQGLNQIESCGEGESEKEVLFENKVDNVQQQIKVSNVNCSCRVF